MNDVTLEKLDIIRERTGVTYSEAKNALEICEGDVVEALIFIEDEQRREPSQVYTTLEGFKEWIEKLVEKGNIKRIKIKKDDKVIVDIPLNAGVAAGVIAVMWTPLMLLTIATAVVTKITVEITNEDGSVEIINKVIKNSATDIYGKATDMALNVKDKIKGVTENVKHKVKNNDVMINDEPIYKYTVNFNESDKK